MTGTGFLTNMRMRSGEYIRGGWPAGLVEGILDLARYEYRCARHGVLEVSRPMGQAADVWACPVCDDEAVRVFSAPMVSLAPRAMVAAIDRTEKTRDEPEVVSSLPRRHPSRQTLMAPPNPAFRRLPRP